MSTLPMRLATFTAGNGVVASAALPRVADLMESFGTSFTAEERRQFAELLTRYIDELSRRGVLEEAP